MFEVDVSNAITVTLDKKKRTTRPIEMGGASSRRPSRITVVRYGSAARWCVTRWLLLQFVPRRTGGDFIDEASN